jgi:serine phosphatase RsbU (regulator of sigma subunit)
MDSNVPSPGEKDALAEILRKQLMAYSVSSEISRVVSKAPNLEAVLTALCLGFQDWAGYKRAIVFGFDKPNFCLKPLKTMGFEPREIEPLHFGLDFLSGEYADAIFRNKHILVDDVPEFDAFFPLNVRAYVAFPLLARITDHCWEMRRCGKTKCPCYEGPNPYCWSVEGAAQFTDASTEDERRLACVNCAQFKCVGLLWLDLTGRPMITGEDTAMISSIAAQAGMVMESFQMYDSLRSANYQLGETYRALQDAHSKLQRDLRQANAIQKKLLPASFPARVADVSAVYKSHMEVGGDYYDCFELDEDRLGLVVADVSGHGVAAALMMSMFKMLLKGSPARAQSPARTLCQINDTFLTELNSQQFVTVFYAIWNSRERTLTYTSAGHHPIFLMDKQSGELLELRSSGLFVGVLEDIKLKDTTLTLGNTHRIALFTDGLSEAANPAKEQFGHQRLGEIMQRDREGSCKDFVNHVLESVDAFCEGIPVGDDITFFACDL